MYNIMFNFYIGNNIGTIKSKIPIFIFYNNTLILLIYYIILSYIIAVYLGILYCNVILLYQIT